LTTTATSCGATNRPRLIVVSYLAHAPFAPRGIRTRELVVPLLQNWSVELVAGSAVPAANSRRSQDGRSFVRRTLHLTHSSILLDRFEPWSVRRFFSWRPQAAGALLIGFPFSPIAYAARRLAAVRIPYVVDIGDPWVLTAERPVVRNLARVRAKRAEHRLWAGASGVVVTTQAQAQSLGELFPKLPMLVRPNGLPLENEARLQADVQRRKSHSGSVLRLVHFGDLSSARLDIVPFLTSLDRAGVWEQVEFHQYGSDWTGKLSETGAVRAVFHEPRAWEEIIRIASNYDLAIVVGNRDWKQLPSKAVAYLQLPVPRLAVVGDAETDALANYVKDKAAWLTLNAGANDAARQIEGHLSRRWSVGDLTPPVTESWERISEDVADFVYGVLRTDGDARRS